MQINIVHSAIMGHKMVWEERKYLLKLALVPILVKLICTFAVYTNDFESVQLRQVLIMLPSYFFEGWMIAQFVRTLLTGEKWPMRISANPSKDQMAFVYSRARGLLAAIICFVLIMMFQSGSAVLLESMQHMTAVDPKTTSGGASMLFLFLGIVLMLATIWAFRLVWLYIPLVILAPIKPVLYHLRGMMTSLYMIGVWVMAVVPVMFVTLMLSGLLMGGASVSEQSAALEGGTMQEFMVIIFHVVGQSIAQIISVASMTYVFKDILVKYGAKPIFSEPNKPF